MKINYAIALAAAVCQAQAAQQTISPKVIISSINKITDLSGDTADLAQDPASILTAAPRIVSNFVQIVELALGDITMLGGSTSGLPDPSTVLSMPGMPSLPGIGGSSGSPGTGGSSGISGSSGMPGSSGSSGMPGPDGSSAVPGTGGSSGISGSSGMPGSDGSSAVPGTDGTSGMTGSSGSDGSSGMPGSGSSGSDGSSGTGTSGSSPSGTSDSPSSDSTPGSSSSTGSGSSGSEGSSSSEGSSDSSGSSGPSGSSGSSSSGSSSSNPKFSKSDQTGICDAFSDFVKVHQNLLKIIIGQNGILSKTPFTAPIAAVLRILEGGVDRLAFTIIGFVPTCADTAKMDLKMLDATLDQTVSVYSIVPGSMPVN